MPAGEGTTWIGKSVRIIGDVTGSEDLVIEGEVQGTIRVPGSRLTVGASARVRGDVAAQDVIVLGRLEGDVRAKGRVELRASSAVLGNIYAGTLSMEENAAFRGQIDPSRAQEALPERPAQAPAAPAVPARATPLPAMLAAVAARSPQETGESAKRPDSLFNETEA